MDRLSQGETQKDLHLRIVTLTEGSYLEEDCSLGDQLGVITLVKVKDGGAIT